MTTTMRRGKRGHSEIVDERYVLLHFTDGLIIDPRRCPAGVLAHPHWRRADGLFVPGEPNAECACPKPAEQVA